MNIYISAFHSYKHTSAYTTRTRTWTWTHIVYTNHFSLFLSRFFIHNWYNWSTVQHIAISATDFDFLEVQNFRHNFNLLREMNLIKNETYSNCDTASMNILQRIVKRNFLLSSRIHKKDTTSHRYMAIVHANTFSYCHTEFIVVHHSILPYEIIHFVCCGKCEQLLNQHANGDLNWWAKQSDIQQTAITFKWKLLYWDKQTHMQVYIVYLNYYTLHNYNT